MVSLYTWSFNTCLIVQVNQWRRPSVLFNSHRHNIDTKAVYSLSYKRKPHWTVSLLGNVYGQAVIWKLQMGFNDKSPVSENGGAVSNIIQIYNLGKM